MALVNRMKTFTILTLLGVSLYILLAGLSSNLITISINYQNFKTNDNKDSCKNFENWDEIVDLEWLMFEHHDDQENQKIDEESRRNFQNLFKKCQSYVKSDYMSPSDFKIHQEETLKLFKGFYLNSSLPSVQNSNLTCGRFPSQSDLNITDIYWQVKNTTNGTFYLYNAYYDDRVGVDPPVIRILGMINILDPVVRTFCQFWYENISQPLISEVYEYRYIWNRKWGYNKKGATPYLISCKVLFPLAPSHVSLVQKRCGNANNLMKVKNKRPKNNQREYFIVSVKKLDYMDDVSLQIIEWCEILKILGVNKVEIYVLNVHKNVLKVLEFYESEDFVKIKFIKFPSDLPNERKQSWHQWIQNELISFHDTFYENMYSYDMLVPMDTDEFIMPLRQEDKTWKDLMVRTITKSIKKGKSYDCYPVENHYFLLKSSHENETIPGIPKNLYFLPNIYRAANFTPNGGNAKTFLRMDRILTIHNHFPFSCLSEDDKCNRFQVAREDGQLSHYRHDCTNPECKESLDDPEKDVSLWKYKDEILENVNKILKKFDDFSGGTVKIKLET